MFKLKKKSLLISFITLSLCAAAYLAADRYLIEHVEIADVSAYSETAVISTSPTQADGSVVSAVSASLETPQETATTEAASTVEAVTSDDWNYQSSTVSISIQKVTTGSGNNTLVYFVADVVLADATQLKSAFADNQFGRNIVAYTSQIAAENDAIFAINGDYYGFRTDGIVIRNGVLFRDEPARIGLAYYRDGSVKVYDETQTSAQALLDEGVWNTLSFGPALLEDGNVVGGISNIEVDTNFGNHSIQGNQPRTGVGIIDDNHFIFVVVDGRSRNYSRGASLTEFAAMFKELGCSTAYNIDGGGSSTMYFMGRLVNNPLGRNDERGTSDILYIGQ